MRLFTAIDLPASIRDHLGRIAQHHRAHPALKDLSWTKLDNLHITLKFLADIPDERIPALTGALAKITLPPMTLTLSHFLVLPGQGPARILAANVKGDLEPLSTLFTQIESTVQPLGVGREARPFKPHVTIARIRRPSRRLTAKTLARAIDPAFLPTAEFMATRFTLFQSKLDPGGAVYTPIASFS